MEKKDVKLFVLDGCHTCESVERVIKEEGVECEIVNVTNNDKLISQLIEATHQMEMPILFIDDLVLCGHNINIKELSGLLK